MAVGDGANDLPMLQAAGLGVGVPRPRARPRGGAGADRPWRPHRAPVPAGLPARRVRARPEPLFLEPQRHEAQVALAVDQQQDRLLALLLGLIDLAPSPRAASRPPPGRPRRSGRPASGSPRPPVEPSPTSVITTPLASSGRLNCVRCSASRLAMVMPRASILASAVGDGASGGGPSSATLLVLGQLAQDHGQVHLLALAPQLDRGLLADRASRPPAAAASASGRWSCRRTRGSRRRPGSARWPPGRPGSRWRPARRRSRAGPGSPRSRR